MKYTHLDFISPNAMDGKTVSPWYHNACANTLIIFITFPLPLPSSFLGLYIYGILPSSTQKALRRRAITLESPK